METFYGTTLLAKSHYYIKLRLSLSNDAKKYLLERYPSILLQFSASRKDRASFIYKLELVIPTSYHLDWIDDLEMAKAMTEEHIAIKHLEEAVNSIQKLRNKHAEDTASPEDFNLNLLT